MRSPIPFYLGAVVAVVAVAALIWVVLETGGGEAPGSGQQAFDAPGCQPSTYAGPGLRRRILLRRNCPNPVPVVLHTVRRVGGGWRVIWDASRSFDPVGGELVNYEWGIGGGHRRLGPVIAVGYVLPGLHEVVLFVTDDSGMTGTIRDAVKLP